MKRKLSLIMAFILLTAVCFAACAPAVQQGNDAQPPPTQNVGDSPQPAPAAPAKDTLVIGQYGDPPNLDPHNALNDNAMRVNVNVYDPLVRMDKNFEPVPSVAERWETSGDGLVWTFYIKSGIKFHNGDELTAKDVVFSINRGVASPQAAPSYAGVVGAELAGDNAVKVTLKSPKKTLLAAFSLPLAGILCERAVSEAEANGGVYGREPVGSGPFMFSEWVTGEKVVLTAFEDYHMGAPKLKTVTFRAIEDQSAALISLEKGDIDMYVDLNQSNFNQVMQSPNLTLHTGRSVAYQFLAFNCSKAPFDNVLVRRAIAHALDKVSLVEGINGGVGEVIDSIATSDMFGYTDKIVKYDYNLETAKALLNEAGYPNGFTCDIAVYLDSYSKYAQVLSYSLSQIGITANVVMLERSAFDDLTKGGKADIFFYGNTYSGLDISDVSIYNVLHSSTIASGSSRTHYSDPQLDDLLVRAQTTMDTAASEKIYNDILVLLSEQVPIVPFIWTYKNIAANSDIMNVYAQPQSLYFVYEYEWAG